MPEHHAYDHSTPTWGWVLIVIAIAMFAALILHVVVDRSRSAPVPGTVGAAQTQDISPVLALL